MNRLLPILLVVALVASAACRRRRSASQPADSSAPAAETAAAPASAPSSAPVAKGSELPKDLQASTPGVAQMNLAVQEFVVQMGRPPTRLEELLEKRVLPRFPPTSPGMKYTLTKGRNNQPEVKEVAQ